MSFETLGLAPALVRVLSEIGYTQPTPIQSEAIPLALAGHDLLGGAQTGTGKTAAFALPLLHRLSESTPAFGGPRRIRALVLTPTRELAHQVHESLRTYGKHARLASTCIYGGAGMNPQLDALRRGVDILVATPGRLIDHLERGSVKLGDVEVLVLDEADRMLDMGFLPAIKRILNKLPSTRQTMLFSATFEEAIKKLALEFMRNPQQVQVSAQNMVAHTVTHRAHPVDNARKRDLLIDILSERWQEQILVFGKTKHGCNRLAEQIEKAGIKSVAIHGNKSQSQRLKALADFKSGKARVLVATDVAARGLDIPLLPLVINFDLPMVAEDYVHRIGRTGRAGVAGRAVSLVTPGDHDLLRGIQRLLTSPIEHQTIEAFAANESSHEALPDAGRRNQGRQNRGFGGNRGNGNGRPSAPRGRGNRPPARFGRSNARG